jgi:transcriptional regulator with XRE-family HTH domain
MGQDSVYRRITSTSLAVRIINYLVKQGHTQADVARMLGVSPGFVSLVKSRERGLTIDHLERLALELNMPLGAFLTAVTEPPVGTPDPSGRRALMKDVLKLADEARAAIWGEFVPAMPAKSTPSRPAKRRRPKRRASRA